MNRIAPVPVAKIRNGSQYWHIFNNRVYPCWPKRGTGTSGVAGPPMYHTEADAQEALRIAQAQGADSLGRRPVWDTYDSGGMRIDSQTR